MDMTYELGFIGAGNMAEAIARAAIDRGVLQAGQMIAFDPTPARQQVFRQLGVALAADNAAVIQGSRQVMLAVKPQVMSAAAADLARHLRDEQVVISIMAGITCAKLVATVGRPLRLVRVMPNTPLMAGKGMAGVALGPHARDGDEALTLKLFTAAGEAVVVDEKLIDAVTAVSGSGPAYVFYLAEAMEQAARDLGLGEHAPLFVKQTILGAAMLLTQSSDPPAELRRKVTSPGGTTQAAITHLESHQVRQAIEKAIAAAKDRSVELGR
jgi:pyrroline-5-carboxylate reductase